MSRKLLLFFTSVICLFTLVVSATSVNFTVHSDDVTATATVSSVGNSGGEPTFTPTPGGRDNPSGDASNSSTLPSRSNEIDISSLGIENLDKDVQFIDVDKQGLIYLATYKGQVYILSAAGEFMTQFKIDPPVLNMKVDTQGNIFIADGEDIVQYDHKGKVLLKLQHPPHIYFRTFALTSKGNFVGVADYRSPKVNKTVEALFFFDHNGKQIKLVDQFLGDKIDLHFTTDLRNIAVGAKDDLYFFENSSPQNLVYHVDANGKYIDQFPINVGPFPSAVAVDSQDWFYIGGFGGLFILDSHHTQKGVLNLADGAITYYSIAIGKNDTIYVTYQRNKGLPSAQAFVDILEWPKLQ